MVSEEGGRWGDQRQRTKKRLFPSSKLQLGRKEREAAGSDLGGRLWRNGEVSNRKWMVKERAETGTLEETQLCRKSDGPSSPALPYSHVECEILGNKQMGIPMGLRSQRL